MNKKMRVLGVDLGMQRTGLAISDALGISVRGLETFKPGNRQHDFDYLLSICQKEEVEAIVLGFPENPSSKNNAQKSHTKEVKKKNIIGERAQSFAQFIKNNLPSDLSDLKVYLIDESLSSIEASFRLVASDVPKKKRKKLLDSESARVIVERFLSGCPNIEIQEKEVENN